MAANNVTRMLDAKKIVYEVLKIPREKLSALEVAEFLQVAPEIVYKTIVAKRSGQGKPVLAVLPATGEVNLKKLARALGEKKMRIPSRREAEEMTGLLAGGISALALINKGFQVVVDESASYQEKIIISAGQRGLQIVISPRDLAKLTNARFLEVSS